MGRCIPIFDDITLIVGIEEELLELLNLLENSNMKCGLKIDYKTKITIIDGINEGSNTPRRIENCDIVELFSYLDSILHNSGSCEPWIRKRIQLVKVAMVQLTKNIKVQLPV